MADYVMYIDDSGTKEYDVNRNYGVDGVGGNSRHFVFGGVLISTVESGNLVTAIRALKEETFGTDRVEIKSTWLRIPRERKKRYLEKFAISEDSLTAFVNQFYQAICDHDLKLLAAVVDKVHVQELYPEPYYAPAIAYEILMQRVVQQCGGSNTVSVVIDNMDGATPKAHQYKANLIKHHKLLRKRGSYLQRDISFAPLAESLNFVDSAVSNQVQVADVVSYNILRQFRDHGDAWENVETIDDLLPTYEWFERLAHKFRQGPDCQIQGYGIVKFPLRKRVKWCVPA